MNVPGVIAGRFQIEHEIGRGGTGTVYRARHTSLNRTVAVKVLKPEYAREREIADRFMREARTTARVRHTSAAMIYDAGRLPDGRPFMVMEYVEGRTLAEVLRAEGRLTPERAVKIACDILAVLEAAHACGVVHRDLKPSNVMLRGEQLCVLDFGIAKVLAPDADSDATRTCATTDSGMLVGTPRYMSPEQCTGDAVGPASDLYSVGIMLYEMLSGQPPFTDQLASAVLVKQATQMPAGLHTLRADCPRPLVVATHKLLAKEPRRRPALAREARIMLEDSVRHVRAERAETAPFATTVRTLSENRRFTFSHFAAIALIAGVLCTGAFAWTRRDEARASAQATASDTIMQDTIAARRTSATRRIRMDRTSATRPRRHARDKR